MRHLFLAAAAASVLMTIGTAQADTVKVGYMTTLSGSAGIIGKQMQDGVKAGYGTYRRQAGWPRC